MSQLRCSICGREWDELPPDAVKIGQRSGAYPLYYFAGSVHNVGLVRIGFKKGHKAVKTAEENGNVQY